MSAQESLGIGLCLLFAALHQLLGASDNSDLVMTTTDCVFGSIQRCVAILLIASLACTGDRHVCTEWSA